MTTLITDPKEFLKMPISSEITDIVSFVGEFFEEAINNSASDIHIEPTREFVQTRFRVSGDFAYISKISHEDYAKVLSRIKILANLRIDEKQRPQDGKISYRSRKYNDYVDIRVSILPIVFGEKIVMRILRQDTSLLNLDKLNLIDANLDTVKRCLKSKFGIILVTGPTGSGKSTTLFSMLKFYNPLEHNISTLEDPVEYNIPFINQTQVKPMIEFDFALGLRSLLRQDPDIIMVGEMRDKETATLAIEAALTGHLVFSTLHTNSAAGTIQRLTNMGIEPFLISSALKLVISQRLLKRLCDKCATPYKLTEAPIIKKVEAALSHIVEDRIEDLTFYRATGCPECVNTGYKGRIGVHEVLENNPAFDSLILDKASANDIENKSKELGMITIFQDALIKAAMGKTSIEEAMKLL